MTAALAWRQKSAVQLSIGAVVLACVLTMAVVIVREWRGALAWRERVRLPRHAAAARQRSAFRTAHAYVILGNDLLRQGNVERAIENYQLALTVQPDFLNARINIASAHAVAGDSGKAIEEYLRILEIKPQEPMTHFNLGLLFAERGERDKAAEHFRRVLEVNPSDSGARQELCKLVKNCLSAAPNDR